MGNDQMTSNIKHWQTVLFDVLSWLIGMQLELNGHNWEVHGII